MHLATLQEEHFLKADLAAARLEQVLEIDPNNEDAYWSSSSETIASFASGLDLVNAYDRHIAATADRKAKIELYGAIAQVYADEVEDAERAVDAYKNIVGHRRAECTGVGGARQALREAWATPRGRSAVRRALPTSPRTPSRGSTRSTRIGKGARRKARGPRRGTRALRDGARSREPVALHVFDAGGAPSDRHQRGRLRQGRALFRTTSKPIRSRRVSAPDCSWSSAGCGAKCSAITRPRSLAWESAFKTDPERTKTRRCRARRRVHRAKSRWAKAEPLLKNALLS